MLGTQTRYFELKNENSLPISGRFIDPYDNTTFKVYPKDKLIELVEQFLENRRNKNNIVPPVEEVKTMIVTMLAETCSDADLRKHFIPKTYAPQLNQTLTFVKTLSKEFLSGGSIPVEKRQQRARKCLKCRAFHKGRAKPPEIINKLPIPTLQSSLLYPEEKELGVCGLCGCGMAAKVKFQLPAVMAGLTPEDFDRGLRVGGPNFFDTCWILSESLENAVSRRLLEAKLKHGSVHGEKLLQAHITRKIHRAKANG